MPVESESCYWLALVSLIGSPSSELFLSLSGSVLLPIKTGMRKFYKRRYAKLIPPLVFWSVATLSIYLLLGKIDVDRFWSLIAVIPFSPVIGVYWFVYVMVGLYLLAPLISPWLRIASKKQLEFVLIIWGFNMILPYVNLFVPGYYDVTGNFYYMFNYFGGFLGYWFLGYYLRTYPIVIGYNRRWILCVSGVVMYLFVLLYLKKKGEDVLPYYDNLQIGSVLLVMAIYTVIQNSVRRSWIITDIAKYSYGIYLIHIVVVRELVWKLFADVQINPLIETIMIAIVSLMFSYIISKAISKIPYGKYIVGC